MKLGEILYNMKKVAGDPISATPNLNPMKSIGKVTNGLSGLASGVGKILGAVNIGKNTLAGVPPIKPPTPIKINGGS